MAEFLPLVVLWLATAGLIGAVVAFRLAAARLRDEAPRSNVIVLPPRATRSGPTHVVRLVPSSSALHDQETGA